VILKTRIYPVFFCRAILYIPNENTLMAKWIDLPAIISTIIGGLIVLWATFWIQSGKLVVFIRNKRLAWMWVNDEGGRELKDIVPGEKIPEGSRTRCSISFEIEFYNSSSFIKIARDLKLLVICDEKRAEAPLYNENDYEATALNFKPKEIESCRFSTVVWDIVVDKCKIYLKYRDQKNRVKRILLHQPD
jgi:hypothetical protein